jgi:hypothetical protein
MKGGRLLAKILEKASAYKVSALLLTFISQEITVHRERKYSSQVIKVALKWLSALLWESIWEPPTLA